LQTQAAARSWDFAADAQFRRLSVLNQIMVLWFNGKCIDDSTWCA